MAGAAAYIAAPTEPAPWLGALILVASTAAGAAILLAPGGWAFALRRALAWGCMLSAFFGLGFTGGQLRAFTLATPTLSESERPRRIEGWVAAIDPSDRTPRLRILVRHIEGEEAPPRYVRIAVPAAGMLAPGRATSCLAMVGPPAGPLAPRAYDFSRRAWFERLSATGFGIGRCRPAAFDPPPGWLDRARLWLAAARYDMSGVIQRAAPGRGGAIAAALVTGDRSPVNRATNEALRDSGLGHLLSVSGIHMGVVGGLVFAALLWVFSLIGPIALRVPVKKIAASGALIALAAYLVISGSSVPAVRAFVMACVAFGAILLDRPAISMRGLALAAIIVTLIWPEAVLEPGYQMSFAATMALVALFEMMKRAPHEPALPTPGPLIGALQSSMRGIGGALLISLVAGLATDPFAIYHFQRFSIYSLPANLIAAPIMSFLVAPAAGVAAVLAPFGLADPAIELMASALDLIAAVGATFGGRPEALRALPQPPDEAFVLVVFAMVWAALWRGALRWLGLAPFVAGLALYIAAPRPVIAFDADLRALYAGVNEEQGWRLIAGRGRSTYARDRLGATLGIAPPRIERLTPPEQCAAAWCAWTTPRGRAAFLVSGEAGFEAACVAGAIVIAAPAAPEGYAERCGLAALSDASDRARGGGAFLYETADGVRDAYARPEHIARPWTRRSAPDEAHE